MLSVSMTEMSRDEASFSGLDTDARKTASAVEQGPEPRALAAKSYGTFPSGGIKAAMRTLPQFLGISPRSLQVKLQESTADIAQQGRSGEKRTPSAG